MAIRELFLRKNERDKVLLMFYCSGIGLALVAAVKGYKTIITLPEKMSAEKVAVLKALNATIIRTPTAAAYDSPESHIGVARRLEKELPNAHILDQYGNPDNPLAHELGTAEEIWAQSHGTITAIVAGAGTGGTITGLQRGLHKHNPSIKIIAADPQGSILALPASLNDQHANDPYKVEGIGYDFIPDVLDQRCVTKWYKTDDRSSFYYARRLIAEEGLLVGGSAGSAMTALVELCRDPDMKIMKDDVIVVVLPDSIRSYLSKFADDDWLAANDLLPPTPPSEEVSAAEDGAEEAKNGVRRKRTVSSGQQEHSQFGGATVRSLRLKPVQTIPADQPCAAAIETMRDKGFDQLPVLAKSGRRLVGLVTLGNLLSRISHGRATGKTEVSEVMFDFSRISEVVTDPRDMMAGKKEAKKGKEKRQFVEITMDTPLSALNRFFEWQSAAVVTEREKSDDGGGKGALKPVAVVTKVDLLTWLLRENKMA